MRRSSCRLRTYDRHKGIQLLVRDLNGLYRTIKALHEFDFDGKGFEWIDFKDWENSVISFLRKGEGPDDVVLVACNFTPVPRPGISGRRSACTGSGRKFSTATRRCTAEAMWATAAVLRPKTLPCFGRKQSLQLMLPPLGAVVLQYEKPKIGKDPESDAGAGTGQKEPQP